MTAHIIIPPMVDATGRVIDPPRLQCEAWTLKDKRCQRAAEYGLHGFMVCHIHRHGTTKALAR